MAKMRTAEKALEIFKSYLGSTDGNAFIKKFNQMCGWGMGYNQPWCAISFSVVVHEAGMTAAEVPYFASCTAACRQFTNMGRYRKRGTVTPQPGWAVLFNWDYDNTQDHVGMVEKVEGGMLYTIEGNSNNMVRRKSYSLNSSYIDGYITIPYEVNDMNEADVRKIVREEIAKKNPVYGKLDELPTSFRVAVEAWLKGGIVFGETPDNIGLSWLEARIITIVKRAFDKYDPIYRTVEDVPAWGRKYVQALIDCGSLNGEEILADGTRILNIRYSTVRLLYMLMSGKLEDKRGVRIALSAEQAFAVTCALDTDPEETPEE